MNAGIAVYGGSDMIRGVLLDLSGTLHVGDTPVPGAVSAVRRLQEAGFILRFVTNTSRKTRKMLHDDLVQMGFAMPQEHIFTGALAVRRYLEEHRLRPHLLVHRNLVAEFDALDRENPNAVVVGFAEDDFTFHNMNLAFRHLKAGARLLATGRTRYFEGTDGLVLDAGPFIAALEYAAETEALVLGKPSADFFLAAAAEIGLAPAECIMVGDDADSDVAAAARAGLQAVLVQTGKYRRGDEAKLPEGAKLAKDVVTAVEEILTSLGRA
jgi:HAD superfamily hydrolase (TIGR01458 family)